MRTNNIRSLLEKISVLSMAVLMLPQAAHAAWFDISGPNVENFDELIQIGLNTAIILAAVVAVVFLVMSGFKYMMASGDTSATESAQKGIANALIGLVICIVAALIVNFVLGKLGMEAKPVDTLRLMLPV